MTTVNSDLRALRLMLIGFSQTQGIPEVMYVGLRHFVMQLIGPAATFRLDDVVELNEEAGTVMSQVPKDILIQVVFDEPIDVKTKEDRDAVLL